MLNEPLKKLVRGEPHWDEKLNENVDILETLLNDWDFGLITSEPTSYMDFGSIQ